MKNPSEMICQDCLRVVPYTSAGHLGFELCLCGGEYCGCCQCQKVIRALKKGHRDKRSLGLNSVVLSWSAQYGAIFK
jgi:hypothetical protein